MIVPSLGRLWRGLFAVLAICAQALNGAELSEKSVSLLAEGCLPTVGIIINAVSPKSICSLPEPAEVGGATKYICGSE